MKDYYSKRFQYHWPQHVVHPWMPDIQTKGRDEFCNRAIWINIPFLGAITIFYSRKLRTWDDGWCDECRQDWDREHPNCPYLVGMIGMSNGVPIFLERSDYE